MTSLTSDFRQRCAYKTRSGAPCRYSALPSSSFCKRHILDATPSGGDPRLSSHDALATELAEAASDSSSQGDLQKVMTKIFLAVLQRRLSRKEAGVLTYMAQTILHAQRAVAENARIEMEIAQSRPRTTKGRTLRRPLRRNGQTPRRNNPPHPRAKIEATHIVAGLQGYAHKDTGPKRRSVKKVKEEWRENS
jgi:hypothetical protein